MTIFSFFIGTAFDIGILSNFAHNLDQKIISKNHFSLKITIFSVFIGNGIWYPVFCNFFQIRITWILSFHWNFELFEFFFVDFEKSNFWKFREILHWYSWIFLTETIIIVTSNLRSGDLPVNMIKQCVYFEFEWFSLFFTNKPYLEFIFEIWLVFFHQLKRTKINSKNIEIQVLFLDNLSNFERISC